MSFRQTSEAQARQALDEARWHAEIAASSFGRLDLIGGYDQAKWRLPLIVDALARLDDALDVLVAPENRGQPWVQCELGRGQSRRGE